MQTFINILVTIIVFGILILSHEAGHFFVAKLCKVKVNEFSLGMGPAIFKKQGKETLYTIRALPIGGYVQMDGEDGGGDCPNSFNKKPYYQRFLILVMGAVMNILLGFILICIINSQTALLPTNIVARFDENSVSSECGLKVDDKIVSINDYKIDTYLDLNYALSANGIKPLKVTVIRDGEEVTLSNVSFPIVEDEQIGECYTPDFYVYGVKRSFLNSIKYSFDWTISISKSIYSFFGSLFTGGANLNNVSGPVGTTTAIGSSLQYGLNSLLLMVALISINLGIVNLLPFPALDGGRIVLLGIEAVRKKPLNPKIEMTINAVGLIILLSFMLLISVKDVLKLF